MSDGIDYYLIRSDRKTCQIQVKADGSVIVRAPKRMPERDIDDFVLEKAEWIERAQSKVLEAKARAESYEPLGYAEINALADEALDRIPPRVKYFAALIGVEYGRITVRNQKTRWGSCSGKSNLNFNCLLMLAPEEVLDYVIVHELCHLKEMNHSPRFWAEVERVMPDYKERRLWLKRHGGELIGRMK
jgi:predicted metal-dependent hydrolase